MSLCAKLNATARDEACSAAFYPVPAQFLGAINNGIHPVHHLGHTFVRGQGRLLSILDDRPAIMLDSSWPDLIHGGPRMTEMGVRAL